MHPIQDEKTASKWLKESQKGFMRIAFLILLSKKPCHGYEMMKEVDDRTEGFWKPTAGGVYPILQSLEQSGYIKGEWGPQKRKHKIYQITASGKKILNDVLLTHGRIAENMNNLFKEYVGELDGVLDFKFRHILRDFASNKITIQKVFNKLENNLRMTMGILTPPIFISIFIILLFFY